MHKIFPRILSLGCSAAFLFWVMPLGAFIKPGQESMACHGKRAFHMCSMMAADAPAQSSNQVTLASASSMNENGPQSGSANDFHLMAADPLPEESCSPFFLKDAMKRALLLPSSIDPPPRLSTILLHC